METLTTVTSPVADAPAVTKLRVENPLESWREWPDEPCAEVIAEVAGKEVGRGLTYCGEGIVDAVYDVLGIFPPVVNKQEAQEAVEEVIAAVCDSVDFALVPIEDWSSTTPMPFGGGDVGGAYFWYDGSQGGAADRARIRAWADDPRHGLRIMRYDRAAKEWEFEPRTISYAIGYRDDNPFSRTTAMLVHANGTLIAELEQADGEFADLTIDGYSFDIDDYDGIAGFRDALRVFRSFNRAERKGLIEGAGAEWSVVAES